MLGGRPDDHPDPFIDHLAAVEPKASPVIGV
jgi:hypothetical protein